MASHPVRSMQKKSWKLLKILEVDENWRYPSHGTPHIAFKMLLEDRSECDVLLLQAEVRLLDVGKSPH